MRQPEVKDLAADLLVLCADGTVREFAGRLLALSDGLRAAIGAMAVYTDAGTIGLRRFSYRGHAYGLKPRGSAGTTSRRPAVENISVATEEDIREIARSLPGSFERESYGGRPSWRTSPRMFAWIREEPEALVVWVESLEAKDALLATDPGKFFTTSHYDGQPIVLIRLEAVEVDEARELVTESWCVRAPRPLSRGRAGGERP